MQIPTIYLFSFELYALKPKFKEFRDSDVIPHLKKFFAYACAQNEGNSTELAKTLKKSPIIYLDTMKIAVVGVIETILNQSKQFY